MNNKLFTRHKIGLIAVLSLFLATIASAQVRFLNCPKDTIVKINATGNSDCQKFPDNFINAISNGVVLIADFVSNVGNVGYDMTLGCLNVQDHTSSTFTYEATDALGQKATCKFRVSTLLNCDMDPQVVKDAINITLTQKCDGSADAAINLPAISSLSGPVEYIVVSSSTEAARLLLSCDRYNSRFTFNQSSAALTATNVCPNARFKVEYKRNLSACLNTQTVYPNVTTIYEDIVKPVLKNCPRDTTVKTVNACTRVSWTAPTATDNCDTNPSVSSNYASGFCFPIGTTTVIYTAEDESTNTDTCRFKVIVKNPCAVDTNVVKNLKATIIDSCGSFLLFMEGLVNNDGRNGAVEYLVVETPNRSPQLILPFRDTFRVRSETTRTKFLPHDMDLKIYARAYGRDYEGICPDSIDITPVILKRIKTLCDTCARDTVKPVIKNCPRDTSLKTLNGCERITFTAPTATDNCDTDPSVSSNYATDYCFPIGATEVIYTAKDVSGNTSTCSFTVTIKADTPKICKSYDAFNTNAVCGCDALKWQPYGFLLDGIGTCPVDYFKPDGALRFQMNADNTATLKGNFRNNRTWELVVVDLNLSGRTTTPPTGSPNLSLCQQGRSTAIANAWQYFTGMTGTFQIGSKILTINRLGAAFQVGMGANNQNLDKMGASGQFTLSDGKTGSFGLILGNELAFDCSGVPPPITNDVQLSMRTSASTFTRYMTLTYSITAKNVGTVPMKGVVVEFRFPDNTVNGGKVTPSVGRWDEWCADNTPCYKWTIPTLAVGSEAVLDVPLFVLGSTVPIVATASILATSPTDGNPKNNVATTTTLPFLPPIQGLAAQKPTQLVPIIIQKLAPNPTESELFLELESLKDGEITLDFSMPMGQIIRSEKVGVVKGTNHIRLDVSPFAQGIYFVTPSTNTSRNMPIKFVKM